MGLFRTQPGFAWLAWLALSGCGETEGDGGSVCGPAEGIVSAVVDGDTVDLQTGERVRYLMVDAPELSSSDCYAVEARDFNAQLVMGQAVALQYDEECTDRFGRLLAYVSVSDREVNALMVERGFACVLYIPPNGVDRRDEFETLEAGAKASERGMWDPQVCPEVACD